MEISGINKIGLEMLDNRFTENLELIQQDFQKDKENIIKTFESILNKLFEQASKFQSNSEKGPVAYCFFSFLRSCLLTKSYSFRIDLYDDTFYKDLAETADYYTPKFIFKYFDEDTEFFEENIKIKIPYITAAEMRSFEEWYVFRYYRITQKFFTDTANKIKEASAKAGTKMSEDFKVMFGGYFEQGIVL